MPKTVTYNMYEAKMKLSEVVDKARRGIPVTLTNRGKPVAMVVPIRHLKKPRELGFLKGKVRLGRGWDSPIEDFRDYQ